MTEPYYADPGMTLYHGDVLDVLRHLPDESVRCVVTSPPYWNLRDYSTPGQLGLEPTPEAYVANMVAVFAEVRRVLRLDGTCWLNLGDTFAGGLRGGNPGHSVHVKQRTNQGSLREPCPVPPGLKPKDMVGIPWRVAFALQADGWWLRSDIIWHKPNPMPESVTDRPTKSHEYLFLLTKSSRYYYDAAAIAEPVTESTTVRLAQDIDMQAGSTRANGGSKTNGNMKAVRGSFKGSTFHRGKTAEHQLGRASERERNEPDYRNKRSVWTVSTVPYKAAHFATFPPKLIEPCVLAGSKPGDVVLDPFMGSGTTALVAQKHGRKAIGIDLNAEYLDMAIKRNAQKTLWFTEAAS